MKKYLAALAAFALIGTLSACADKEPAAKAADPEQPTATETVVVTETETADPEPSEEPEVDEVVEEEVDPFFTVGETIDLHSWTIKITNIDRDANREIMMANSFNDEAQGTYVLVTYDATYTGKKRIGEPEWDLTWSFSTPNGQVYDEAYAVTPADDQDWPTSVRSGGTIPVQVSFDIKGPVGKSIVTVEDDRNYADFKMAP